MSRRGPSARRISLAAPLSLKVSAAVLLAPMIWLTAAISAAMVRRWLTSSKMPNANPISANDAQVVAITSAISLARIDAERIIGAAPLDAPNASIWH
jgi:hypothetical protein